MSKIVRGVKKAFRKVAKTFKKVAPIILAGAALYFTAGAAMGATAGWTSVASGMGGAVGGSGIVGGALSGAITQAGYGALAGGVISEVQGGSFSQGAKMGAATGAVTGGVTGGVGAARGAGQATRPASAGPQPGPEQPTAGAPRPRNPAGPGAGDGAPPSGGGGGGGGGGGSVPPGGDGGGGGGLFEKGGWLERNQDLSGHVLSGVGQGLMSTAEAAAEKDAVRERFRQIRKNYKGTDPGAGYREFAPGDSGQSPTDKFDPLAYGRFQYVFNPKTGRIERVPVDQG